MTPEQITKEKDAVESQILKLLKGFDTKDIDTMLTLFSTSDELLAFGTDAAEVLRSLSDWEDQLKYDFQLFESAKFGELQNLSIQVSKSGDLAAVLFETPADIVFAGESSHAIWRFSSTLKKEDEKWLIVHLLAAIASEGQSSAEIVEQMKETGTE